MVARALVVVQEAVPGAGYSRTSCGTPATLSAWSSRFAAPRIV